MVGDGRLSGERVRERYILRSEVGGAAAEAALGGRGFEGTLGNPGLQARTFTKGWGVKG